MQEKQPRLLESVRQTARERGLSRKTENAYVNHVRRFLAFDCNFEPTELGVDKIQPFLEHLAGSERVSASTRNQALSALVFFYREVMKIELPVSVLNIKRERIKQGEVTILTPAEVKAILSYLTNIPFLVASLMYGSGLRLIEALNLRAGDLDFAEREIMVRDVKTGSKDRVTILPEKIAPDLQRHLRKVEFLFEDDCLLGLGEAPLPPAIARINKNAAKDWRWQFVFPSPKLSVNNGFAYRPSCTESAIQKAFAEAMRKAEIAKQGCCCHTLRHSFAAHLFENKYDVRQIQNLLGHKTLRTTLAYAQFFATKKNRIQSPLD